MSDIENYEITSQEGKKLLSRLKMSFLASNHAIRTAIQTDVSKPGGPHQLFTDGKLLKDIDAVMSLLQQIGITKLQES